MHIASNVVEKPPEYEISKIITMLLPVLSSILILHYSISWEFLFNTVKFLSLVVSLSKIVAFPKKNALKVRNRLDPKSRCRGSPDPISLQQIETLNIAFRWGSFLILTHGGAYVQKPMHTPRPHFSAHPSRSRQWLPWDFCSSGHGRRSSSRGRSSPSQSSRGASWML